MANRVRQCWELGEPAVVAWCQIGSPLVAETLAAIGYDGVVIDLQHSPTDLATACAMLVAIETQGAEPMVRVASNDAAEIGRLLDAGAYGVVVPMVESAADARSLIDAVHYPPRGRRSFGPRRPLLRYGPTYVSRVGEAVVTLAMIETAEGLHNIDEILAIDGLDGVFVGPADLAIALGLPPTSDPADPRLREQFTRILGRANRAGKRAGIFCSTPRFARTMMDEGYHFVTVAADLSLLATAAKKAHTIARASRSNHHDPGDERNAEGNDHDETRPGITPSC